MFAQHAVCNTTSEFCSEITNNSDCFAAPGCYLNLGGDCLICPAGFYCEKNDSTPTKCPDGYTSLPGAISELGCFINCETITNQTECTNAAGCYLNGTQCRSCDAGYYCPAGYETQTQCSPGYYCPQYSSEQKKCPNGHTSPEGSDDISDCFIDCNVYNDPSLSDYTEAYCTAAPGCYLNNGRCVDCTAGYYCPANSSTRKKCPLNSTSDKKNARKSGCYLNGTKSICQCTNSADNCLCTNVSEGKHYYKSSEQENQQVNWPNINSCIPNAQIPTC